MSARWNRLLQPIPIEEIGYHQPRVTCFMVCCFLQEAMRMLPVLADGTNRTTTADTRLGPYTIPKGTMVWVPLMGLFNSPRNWADPDKYMPVGCPLTPPVCA